MTVARKVTGALAACLLCLPLPVFAQTSLPVLQPGDVLRLLVPTIPELESTISVDMAGGAAFPLIGSVEVAGLTIAEVRTEVGTKLAASYFRRIDNDSESVLKIRSEEVLVDVVSYRPVYVDGAVAEPGALEFAAGLTVRQAIAARGGVALPTELSRDDVEAQLSRVRSEHEATVLELASKMAELARAQALFDGTETIDATVLDGLDIADPYRNELIAIANARVTAATEQRAEDMALHEDQIANLRTQIVDALRQAESAQEAYASERREVSRIQQLFDNGLYSADRLALARRTFLQTSAQLLNFRSNIAELESDQFDMLRERDVSGAGRKQDLLQQVQDLSAQVQVLSAQANGLAQQDQILSQRQGVALGSSGAVITKHRQGEQAAEADLDSLLMPGDVVTVSLQGM